MKPLSLKGSAETCKLVRNFGERCAVEMKRKGEIMSALLPVSFDTPTGAVLILKHLEVSKQMHFLFWIMSQSKLFFFADMDVVTQLLRPYESASAEARCRRNLPA